MKRPSSRLHHARPEQVVCILQSRLPSYRVQLFEDIAGRLSERDRTLVVAFPDPSPYGSNAPDLESLSWASPLPYRGFGVSNVRLDRVGGLAPFKNARSLVITEAVSNLSSLRLMAQRRIASRSQPSLRTLVWGLGGNLLNGTSRRYLSDAAHRYRDRYVDLWMAYSRETDRAVRSRGMPEERINVVGNATLGRKEASLLRERCLAAVPRSAGPIRAAFIGTMRSAKRIPFLVQALPKLKEICREFELYVVGDGPDHDLVREWANDKTWVTMLGRQEGTQKAQVLARSDFLISPGNVGLVATEAQIAGVPIIASGSSLQTPEFNGLSEELRVVIPDGGSPSVFGAGAGRWMVEHVDHVRNVRASRLAGGATSEAIDTIEDVAERMVGAIAEAERLPPQRRRH